MTLDQPLAVAGSAWAISTWRNSSMFEAVTKSSCTVSVRITRSAQPLSFRALNGNAALNRIALLFLVSVLNFANGSSF